MTAGDGLRRSGPKGAYSRTHQGIPSNPGLHVYRCGKCGQSCAVGAGKWKHRILGFCCPSCKPGAKT